MSILKASKSIFKVNMNNTKGAVFKQSIFNHNTNMYKGHHHHGGVSVLCSQQQELLFQFTLYKSHKVFDLQMSWVVGIGERGKRGGRQVPQYGIRGWIWDKA